MRRSLISYTPRVHGGTPYDALKNRLGCSSIVGTGKYATLPFILFCAEAGSDEPGKPRTVSYALGPDDPDVSEDDKFSNTWAAWQSNDGIRVGKFSSITPPSNATGFKSQLFPTVVTNHLSLAFNRNGWMVIAIEKTSTVIQLRRFVSSAGAIDNREWQGRSPMLFNNWLTYYSETDPTGYDVVCYYLRDGHPDSLFARFERDNFMTEYLIHSGLPSNIDYLTSTDLLGTIQQVLLAKSEVGDDITMTSDFYGTDAADAMGLETELVSGDYFNRAVSETVVDADNGATLTVELVSGALLAVEEEDLSAEKESVTFSVELVQGQYATES